MGSRISAIFWYVVALGFLLEYVFVGDLYSLLIFVIVVILGHIYGTRSDKVEVASKANYTVLLDSNGKVEDVALDEG